MTPVFNANRTPACGTEPVRELVQRKGSLIWAIAPDATVYDAIAMMAEKRVGALLVMAAGRLHGIISERDYARKVFLQGRSSKDTTVREIMTADVVTVSPGQTVDECMRVMTQHHVRHLPVVDSERVVGVISIGDLVACIITAQAETINHLSAYIAGNYPA